VESLREHPVGHAEGDHHPGQPGQGSAGLGQRQHVGHGVADPRGGEHPEVEEGGGEVGPRQAVEQANDHEGDDVLQVVLVAPVEPRR